jgi:hypothetical protein
VGDLTTVEGTSYRVVEFVELPLGDAVDVLAVVEPTHTGS